MRLATWSMLLAAGLFVESAALNVSAADETPTKDTGTVIGKVVDSDNNPVKGAVIDITVSRPKDAAVTGDAPKGPSRVGHGRSGDDGTFKFENIPVGQYLVGVHTGTKGVGRKEIVVKAKETVDTGTITLKLREAAGAGATPSK